MYAPQIFSPVFLTIAMQDFWHNGLYTDLKDVHLITSCCHSGLCLLESLQYILFGKCSHLCCTCECFVLLHVYNVLLVEVCFLVWNWLIVAPYGLGGKPHPLHLWLHQPLSTSGCFWPSGLSGL